jgi:hypothetical protein
VDAAQILDVALSADDDVIQIRPQYRAVPDRGCLAETDVPDEDRARRDPGFWMDNGPLITKRSDQVMWFHWPSSFACLAPAYRNAPFVQASTLVAFALVILARHLP